MHSFIKVKVGVENEETGEIEIKLLETTVGRVLFNKSVPKEVGFINELLTKKALRDIIGMVIKKTNIPKAAKFLDDMKQIGFTMAFEGGLSFNLSDVIIPDEKDQYVERAHKEVEEVMNNYNMGFITNNERYNQIIDIWTQYQYKIN